MYCVNESLHKARNVKIYSMCGCICLCMLHVQHIIGKTKIINTERSRVRLLSVCVRVCACASAYVVRVQGDWLG